MIKTQTGDSTSSLKFWQCVFLPPPLIGSLIISGSVLSVLFTVTHCVNTSSSHRSMPWPCHDSRWKSIGRQHNLIFMTCFALTIYGWNGRVGGGVWGWSVFINRIFLLRTPFTAFVRTYAFSMNPTHCFTNETQVQLLFDVVFSSAERSSDLHPRLRVVIVTVLILAAAAVSLLLDFLRRSRKRGFYSLSHSAPPSAWGCSRWAPPPAGSNVSLQHDASDTSIRQTVCWRVTCSNVPVWHMWPSFPSMLSSWDSFFTIYELTLLCHQSFYSVISHVHVHVFSVHVCFPVCICSPVKNMNFNNYHNRVSEACYPPPPPRRPLVITLIT